MDEDLSFEASIAVHKSYLTSGRKCVHIVSRNLRMHIQNMASNEKGPVILPSDHDIFLVLRRSKADADPWQGYGSLADDGEEDGEGEREDDVPEENVGDEDEVEVAETELDIEDDEKPSPSNSQAEDEARSLDGDESSALLSWTDAMVADAEKVCSADGQRLFSLYLAIHVSIVRAWEQEGRSWGIEQSWISFGLKAQTRQKLLDEGGILLRNVRGFGEGMFKDGLFAIGVRRSQRVRLTYRYYLYYTRIWSLKRYYGTFKPTSLCFCL
jgi:hypothetical protein